MFVIIIGRMCQKRPKNIPMYFMDGPLRTSIEVQLYHTRMDREWEEQFMHQALEEAQLENSKLGNFAARKRCYQFRWQEICIRHLLKVYTLYRGALLSNMERYSIKEIEMIHRLFTVKPVQKQFNELLNLLRCQLAGHNSKIHKIDPINQKQPLYKLNFLIFYVQDSLCKVY